MMFHLMKCRRGRMWRLYTASFFCVVFLIVQFSISLVNYVDEQQRKRPGKLHSFQHVDSGGPAERQLLENLNQSETPEQAHVADYTARDAGHDVAMVSSTPHVIDGMQKTTTLHVRPSKQYLPSDEDRRMSAILSITTFEDLLRHRQINFTYNHFRLTLPRFASEEDLKLFTNLTENVEDLNIPLNESALRLKGVIRAIEGGYVSMDEDCGYRSQFNWFSRRPIRRVSQHLESLCPLLVPDGSSYQHFVDGVLPKIIQNYEILQSTKTPILIHGPKDEVVKDILKTMGFDSSRIVTYKTGYYSADLQINTCITPPLHPVLWQKARRILGVPESATTTAPSVVLFVRKHAGRQMQNLKEVHQFLKDRYKDRLKVINFVSNLEEGKALMRDASILIGVHGGAFYNMLYVPPSAAIVELMPVTKKGHPTPRNLAHKIVWQLAQTMGHSYWRMHIETFSGRGDVMVPVQKLKTLLDRIDYEDFYT